MKIGLQFRSRLEASGEAGDASLQEFQSLLGALSAWANAQHNDDGGHTDVTAESLELTAIRKAALRVVSGWTDLGAGVAYSGAITPTALAGDVNDYSPIGVGETFMIRLTASTVSAIGGLRDGDRVIPLGGRVLALFNAGAETITLTHEEVASSANYRFRLPGFTDMTLAPNTIALVYYDAKSRRWAVLSSTGGDGTSASEYNAGDSGPNITIDWANGTQQIVNLTHDANFTFVNGIEGQEYRLILTEGGAGDFVPDFGAGVIFENDNLKPTAIVAGQVLQVELYYTLLNGGQYFGTYTFDEVELLENDSVTNAILAEMAQSTIKGRAAGAGTGNPQDLTPAQATAILDAFVGDSGSGGTKGLVPAPAAGDAAADKFLAADGSWQVPAGGGGSGGGGVLVFLEEHIASSSAALNFTAWYDTDYDDYLIEIVGLLPATDTATLQLQVSTNGGSSYEASNYRYAVNYAGSGGATGLVSSGSDSFITLGGNIENTGTDGGQCGTVHMYAPGSSARNKNFAIDATYRAAEGNHYSLKGSGWWLSATAVDAFRVLYSSGNIVEGTVRIYGIAKTNPSPPAPTSSQGTFAALPGTCVVGDLYFFTDSVYNFARCDATNVWSFFCDGMEVFPPDLSALTWVNQGGATAVDTYGPTTLSVVNGSVNVRLLKQAAPATPYTATALIDLGGHFNSNFCYFGVAFRESGTGEIAVFGPVVNFAQFTSSKFSSATAFSAHYTSSSPYVWFPPKRIWLRIADDGTNRICSYSLDGITYRVFHTVGRTDFLTANEVGFFIQNESGITQWFSVLSWKVV